MVDFSALLSSYGLPGIALLALGWAYVKKDNKVNELQELRVAEAKESIRALEATTQALDALTETLRAKGAV